MTYLPSCHFWSKFIGRDEDFDFRQFLHIIIKLLYKEPMNQKQFKMLDSQLNSNNLTIIPSLFNTPANSIFRALSLAIYFNEDHASEVIRILRLCLISSCKVNMESSFPSPHRKARYLAKFSHNQQLIDQYFLNPDSVCYTNDNLELASLAFAKRIILFTMNKQGYLEQSLITASSKKTKDPPIMLGRVTSRYYCVQSQKTRSVLMFIRQNILNRVMNSEEKKTDSQQLENKFDENEIDKKPKKSLSDYGESPILNFGVQQIGEEMVYFDGTQSHNPHMYNTYQSCEDFLYNSADFYSMGPKMERFVIPNQRYSGRLKFFDQNGNYGFIVVDGYGTDLFVHFDDLQKTGVTKDKLLNIRNSQQMRFEFTCLQYDGKYKKSKKAVDLKPIPNTDY